MDKLHRLLVHFIRGYSRPLNRAELQTLIYLLELEHVHTYNRQYSETVFYRDRYGLSAPAVLDEIESLCREGMLECGCVELDRDFVVREYGLVAPDRAAAYELPREAATLADGLIARTAFLSLKQLLDLASKTPPMARLAIDTGIGLSLLRRRMNLANEII